MPAKPAAASADVSTNLGVSAVDAGKLIGEDVIDNNGKTVGEIESVIVNTKGKVTSVVLDVERLAGIREAHLGAVVGSQGRCGWQHPHQHHQGEVPRRRRTTPITRT